MTAKTIHQADSLIIDFPVEFPSTGAVTALDGAVAAASADLVSGGVAIQAASTTMVGNTVTASWAAGSFSPGVYRVQLKLTISGQVQTVAEDRIRVLESNA